MDPNNQPTQSPVPGPAAPPEATPPQQPTPGGVPTGDGTGSPAPGGNKKSMMVLIGVVVLAVVVGALAYFLI